MRWLLDQGLPRSAASLLRAAGDDAAHAGEVGLAEAPDHAILQYAAIEDRIVVTLDADFHSLLARSGDLKPSVIRIREEGLKGTQVARIVRAIAGVAAEALAEGCAISYSAGTIRLRRLPILRKPEGQ